MRASSASQQLHVVTQLPSARVTSSDPRGGPSLPSDPVAALMPLILATLLTARIRHLAAAPQSSTRKRARTTSAPKWQCVCDVYKCCKYRSLNPNPPTRQATIRGMEEHEKCPRCGDSGEFIATPLCPECANARKRIFRAFVALAVLAIASIAFVVAIALGNTRFWAPPWH